MYTVQNTAIGVSLLPRLGKVWRRWSHHSDFARARNLIPGILAQLSFDPNRPAPTSWKLQRAEWTETDIGVLTLGPADGLPTAILKLPLTSDGIASLQRQAMVLSVLRADPRLRDWCAVVPEQLAKGEIAGWTYVVERALPGKKAQQLLSDRPSRAQWQATAAACIKELHERTARLAVVDDAMLERWIDQPIDLIRRSIPALTQSSRNNTALTSLAIKLHRVLYRRPIHVSWIHGDFWPGNLLVSPDGDRVTGIVDWDFAGPEELPLHDLMHLLLYSRKLVQHCELGDIIQAFLKAPQWTADERRLLDLANLTLMDNDEDEQAMILLYWLRHIASNLIQSTGYANNRVWVRYNVEHVLQCL